MKVVVAGAGYAGTLAANRLAKKMPETEITVINPRPDFVERVRLHQQIAGTGTVATPLSEMLRDGIRTRVASVDLIGDGCVTLDTGETLGFDYLFLAIGSTVAPLPGTVPVGTWEGAHAAGAALAELPEGGTVTVIGAGPTGIETAAELGYGRPDLSVRLVGARLAPTLHAATRARVRAGLERLKVSVVEDTVTELCGGAGAGAGAGAGGGAGDGSGGTVTLRSKGRLGSDLTLWAVLGRIPDLAGRSGLRVDEHGRALVDAHLRSVSDSRIFVIGDCAAVPGSRAACQTAGPQGAHAADTLVRLIRGRRPKPYSFGYIGTGISLGRRDGVIQISHRDDTARRLYLAGRPAVAGKEGVTRFTKYGSRTATVAWLGGAA